MIKQEIIFKEGAYEKLYLSNQRVSTLFKVATVHPGIRHRSKIKCVSF